MKALAKTKVLFVIIAIFVLTGTLVLLRRGDKRLLHYEKPKLSNRETPVTAVPANDISLVHRQESKEGSVRLTEKKPLQTESTLDTQQSLNTTNAEILTDEIDDLLEDLPLPGVSTRTGYPTNLLPHEETRAIEVWDNEKNMWSQLEGFSGDIDIIYSTQADKRQKQTLTLRATIQMRINDIEPEHIDWSHTLYPPSYEMILTGKDGKWKFCYDSMKKKIGPHL